MFELQNYRINKEPCTYPGCDHLFHGISFRMASDNCLRKMERRDYEYFVAHTVPTFLKKYGFTYDKVRIYVNNNESYFIDNTINEMLKLSENFIGKCCLHFFFFDHLSGTSLMRFIR